MLFIFLLPVTLLSKREKFLKSLIKGFPKEEKNMAKPRVFISSTYYDLKHLRSSLERFIDSLGFEAILSEKGNIAFTPDIPLDESCYREAGTADIFVIIIGGRYGSEASGEQEKMPKGFFERYDSITKKEYLSAVEMDVPTYILVDRAVYSDYETYLKNKNNKSVKYAHVDSMNIFYLIEYILSQPKNNPVHHFDRYSDIEIWLKEQWAGLFRELIDRRQRQIQISTLASQVSQLSEITTTLKRYLEEVVVKVSPEESKGLIDEESKRLELARQMVILEKNLVIQSLSGVYHVPYSKIYEAMSSSSSFNDFMDKLDDLAGVEEKFFRDLGSTSASVRNSFNRTRAELGLKPFEDEDIKEKRKKSGDKAKEKK
jgi:hypothetical protein